MKLKILTASIVLLSSSMAVAGGSHTGNHQKASASPIGSLAKYSPDNRQVEVTMDDTMRFTFNPPLETLKSGEAVTFIIRNNGKMKHEFSIGSSLEQQQHSAMMKKMPGMNHNDSTTVSLTPGAEGEMNWRFSGDEKVVFSCNIPGHFEAGMHHEANIVNTG